MLNLIFIESFLNINLKCRLNKINRPRTAELLLEKKQKININKQRKRASSFLEIVIWAVAGFSFPRGSAVAVLLALGL